MRKSTSSIVFRDVLSQWCVGALKIFTTLCGLVKFMQNLWDHFHFLGSFWGLMMEVLLSPYLRYRKVVVAGLILDHLVGYLAWEE